MHLFAIILLLSPIISCLPQSTQVPNYTKLTDQQVKHLQNKGFGPTVPTAFSKPTANQKQADDDEDESEEDEAVKVASTQARAPVYNGENYPIPNAIQINQRPQPRPQVVQRRPVQQQQVYRPQYVQVK